MNYPDWIEQVRAALAGTSDDDAKEAFEFLVFELRRFRSFRKIMLKVVDGGWPRDELAESIALREPSPAEGIERYRALREKAAAK